MPKNSRVKQAPRMSNLLNLTLEIFTINSSFGFIPCIGKVQDIGNRFQHPTILMGWWGLYPSLCYLFYFRKNIWIIGIWEPALSVPLLFLLLFPSKQWWAKNQSRPFLVLLKTHKEADEWNGNYSVHCLVSLFCYLAHICIAGVRSFQGSCIIPAMRQEKFRFLSCQILLLLQYFKWNKFSLSESL